MSGLHNRSSSYGNFALSTQEDALSDSLDDSMSQKSDSTLEFQISGAGQKTGYQSLAKLLLKEPKKN